MFPVHETLRGIDTKDKIISNNVYGQDVEAIILRVTLDREREREK